MWTFVLTDLGFQPTGEIVNAYDRRVEIKLSGIDTASFRIRLDHPLADQITGCEGYIKAYRDGALRFFGPIVSAEELGSTGSIAVSCAGMGWILSHRIVGKAAGGYSVQTLTDRATIASNIINLLNVESTTALDPGLGTQSSGEAITYSAVTKPGLDCITELATSINGFDWRFLPVENWVNGALTGTNIGQFYARPVIGTSQVDSVFEFGGGRNNLAEYIRNNNRETQANYATHILSQQPIGSPSFSDSLSIDRWKMMEIVLTEEVYDSVSRAGLIQEHVTVRKNPRQTITITPHIDPQVTGKLPQYGLDYDVGDAVRARIMYREVPRFDGYLRIFGVSFDLDSNGVERTTLTTMES